MSSIYDDLDAWIRERRALEAQQDRVKQDDERFAALDGKIDALTAKIDAALAPPSAPSNGGSGDPPAPETESVPSGGAVEDPPNDPPPPELPVERISRDSVPRVYTGDDEPAEVEYIDVTDGETKKRPGRKKGHPTTMRVEAAELPPSERDGE